MGCDIHIIIQVFDPVTGEYKFVRESTNTRQKVKLSEHVTFLIYSSVSTEKSVLNLSDELRTDLLNHSNCQVDECECGYDFNVEFHLRRD